MWCVGFAPTEIGNVVWALDVVGLLAGEAKCANGDEVCRTAKLAQSCHQLHCTGGCVFGQR